jgi:hypothetical protein
LPTVALPTAHPAYLPVKLSAPFRQPDALESIGTHPGLPGHSASCVSRISLVSDQHRLLLITILPSAVEVCCYYNNVF